MSKTNPDYQKPLKITAIICAVLIAVAGIFVFVPSTADGVYQFFTGQERRQKPQFVKPEFDPSAEDGTPDVPEALGYSEIYQTGMAYRASICGNVVINGDTADIYLTNSAENTDLLKVRVLDSKGNIIGQTGLISPGQYVKSVKFDAIPLDGEEITLNLMGYEPETYYSSGEASLATTVRLGNGNQPVF